MAAAVDLRSPLQENRFVSPTVKLSRPLKKSSSVRRSASLYARRPLETADEVALPAAERAVLRESTNSKPVLLPEPARKAVVLGPEPLRADAAAEEPRPEEDESGAAMLQLRIEAMTWAAVAKDETIASLEQRLWAALEIAQAEQGRAAALERAVRDGRAREAAMERELAEARTQMAQLAEDEERLVVQLGNLEVEAGEEDRMYRAEIAALTKQLAATRAELGDSREPQGGENLAAEVEVLRADLSGAMAELDAAEAQKRDLQRRVKVAEKERRDRLARKRAGRGVRPARLARVRTDVLESS